MTDTERQPQLGDSDRQPQLGDQLHYVAHGSRDGTYPITCRAAIVTGPSSAEQPLNDDPQRLNLFVMTPTGVFINICNHDEYGHAPGTWHWPHVEHRPISTLGK